VERRALWTPQRFTGMAIVDNCYALQDHASCSASLVSAVLVCSRLLAHFQRFPRASANHQEDLSACARGINFRQIFPAASSSSTFSIQFARSGCGNPDLGCESVSFVLRFVRSERRDLHVRALPSIGEETGKTYETRDPIHPLYCSPSNNLHYHYHRMGMLNGHRARARAEAPTPPKASNQRKYASGEPSANASATRDDDAAFDELKQVGRK